MDDEQGTQVEEEVFEGPLAERLVHKNWKARKLAYEELGKMFMEPQNTQDEDYSIFFKKMVLDANANAQEAALDTFLIFFDRMADSSKHSQLVTSGLVDKCLGANKPSLQKKALDLLQLLMEIDSPDSIVALLIQGYKQRAPKARLACVQCTVEALRNFGLQVPVKEVLKKDGLPSLFTDSDGKVRKEAQNLTVEIYRYMKDNIKSLPFFNELRDAQKSELEKCFEEVKSQPPPVPARGLRKDKKPNSASAPCNSSKVQPMSVDLMDIVEATPVVSKLPKNFFDVVGGTGKWTERKEVLEVLETLTAAPKLQVDDYLEIIKLLKKLLCDSQIPLVAVSIKIIGQMAKGLRNNFLCYTRFLLSTLLDKFKEKKVTILEPLNATLDLMFVSNCVPLSDFAEDIVAACTNKVPQVRQYTLEWLGKCLGKTENKGAFNKSWKALGQTVAKACDDSCGPVREASIKIIAKTHAILGESAVVPITCKMDKKLLEKLNVLIRDECASKPSIGGESITPRDQPRSSKPDMGVKRNHESPTTSIEEEMPPLKRGPGTVPVKTRKALFGNSTNPNPATAKTKKPESTGKTENEEDCDVGGMTQAEVEQRAAEIIPEPIRNGLESKAFKERQEAIDGFQSLVNGMSDEVLNDNCEVLVRVLKSKPGWKEANFQVLNKTLQIISTVANRSLGFPKRVIPLIMDGLVDKIADCKQRQVCRDCLMVFCEIAGPKFIFAQMIKLLTDSKSPKHFSESLDFMTLAVENFGSHTLDMKQLVNWIKQTFEKNNPDVKKSGVKLLVALRITRGPSVKDMLNDVKPQLLTTIESEFAKVHDQRFQPKKFVRGSENTPTMTPTEFKEDISAHITSTLLNRIADGNWQVRQDALNQVEKIVQSVNPGGLSPSVGQLIPALKSRLADSNKNLAVQSMTILQKLATGMSTAFKVHVKTCAASVFQCLTDNKAHVRHTALCTLKVFEVETGFESLVGFIPKILAMDSPAARHDLSQWVANTLTTKEGELSTSALSPLVKPMISLLQDRNAEIRKHAEVALGCVIQHLGFEAVSKETRDLKPATAKSINSILERYRTGGSNASLYLNDKENNCSSFNGKSSLDNLKCSFGSEDSFGKRIDAPQMETYRQPLATRNSQEDYRLNDNAINVETTCEWSKGNSKTIPSPRPTAMDIDADIPIRSNVNLNLDEKFANPILHPVLPFTQGPVTVLPPPPTEQKQVERISRTAHCAQYELEAKSTPLPVLLSRIQSGISVQCIEGLRILIESYLSNNSVQISGDDVNNTLETIMERVRGAFSSDTLPTRETKSLLNALQALFNRQQFALQVSYDLMYHTVGVLLESLQGQLIRSVPDSVTLLKTLNGLMLKILENSNRTTTFKCLITRLSEYVEVSNRQSTEEKSKLVDLVVKCLLKLTQYVSKDIDSIDLSEWLQELHTFLTKNPPCSFNGRDDTAFRAVKTVLRTLIEAKGPTIKNLLRVPAGSLIISFVDVCLHKNGYKVQAPSLTPRNDTNSQEAKPIQSISKCEVQQSTQPIFPSSITSYAPQPENNVTTNPYSAHLDNIFVMLKNQMTTSSAIEELHRFMTEHPDVDVNPWLSQCSIPFRLYLERQFKALQNQGDSNSSSQFSKVLVPSTSMNSIASNSSITQRSASTSLLSTLPLNPTLSTSSSTSTLDQIRERLLLQRQAANGEANSAAYSGLASSLRTNEEAFQSIRARMMNLSAMRSRSTFSLPTQDPVTVPTGPSEH